jgi:hypothetical protein
LRGERQVAWLRQWADVITDDEPDLQMERLL